MASVKRRGSKPNRWLIRWYDHGERRKERFDGPYEAAKQRAADIEKAKWDRPSTPLPAAPVRQIVRDWFELYHAASTASPRAVVTRTNLTKPFVMMFGDRYLDELTTGDVRSYLVWLRTSGNLKTGGRLRRRTLRDKAKHLKRALAVAYREGCLSSDLAAAIDVPKPRKVVRKTLTDDEVRFWMECAAGTADEIPLALGLYAGLRRGEMAGLERGDVRLGAAEMDVRRAEDDEDEDEYDDEDDTKTDAAYRTVPMPPFLVGLLRDHFARQDSLTPVPERQRDERRVCTGRDGRPVSTDWLTRLPSRFAAKHGLRRIRLHDTRHTYATLLLEAGVSMEAVRQYLGHRDISVTVGLYGHVTVRSARDARLELERLAPAPPDRRSSVVPDFVPEVAAGAPNPARVAIAP